MHVMVGEVKHYLTHPKPFVTWADRLPADAKHVGTAHYWTGLFEVYTSSEGTFAHKEKKCSTFAGLVRPS
jgi:hypothetical protein